MKILNRTDWLNLLKKNRNENKNNELYLINIFPNSVSNLPVTNLYRNIHVLYLPMAEKGKYCMVAMHISLSCHSATSTVATV